MSTRDADMSTEATALYTELNEACIVLPSLDDLDQYRNDVRTGFEPYVQTALAAFHGEIDDIEVAGEPIEAVFRRFMRVLEDERLKIEGFNLLYGGVTCSGCRMGIMSSLFDMKEANQLMYLQDITIVTGAPDILGYIAEDSMVTVGRCVPPEKRSKRHVKGCPPNNLDIVQAIIGDRAKAERHWE